jgi:hypothetical protein
MGTDSIDIFHYVWGGVWVCIGAVGSEPTGCAVGVYGLGEADVDCTGVVSDYYVDVYALYQCIECEFVWVGGV